MLFLIGTAVLGQGPVGPGKGRWEVVTPESQGLSGPALARAEERINNEVGNRTCYLLVKNGKIVFEKYRRGAVASTVSELYSHTKSLCASVFGVAVGQGWASPKDKLIERDWNTRQCNREAQFENVLTMTGQSADLQNPTFLYDSSGLDCLDTIQDFIRQNNKEGLSAAAWKDKFWAEPLGIEHQQWGGIGGYLDCGFGCASSCRDAARVGQLWANEGAWPGEGQMIPVEYARTARSDIFPYAQNSWGAYGYTLWLWLDDDIDPDVFMMAGAGAMCTFVSVKWSVVLTSFGDDEYENCYGVWYNTKYDIIPRGHPEYSLLMNATVAEVTPRQMAAQKNFAEKLRAAEVSSLPGFRAYVMNNTAMFDTAQLVKINKRLLTEGLKPIAVKVH